MATPWNPDNLPDEILLDWHKEPDLCKALRLCAEERRSDGYVGHAALMSAAADEIERQWQPIETVPKDGTAVWVSNGFSMRVAFWANGKKFEHQGSVGGGWRDFFEACHPNRMADLMFAPTCWQALPKSPHRLEAEHL